MQLTLVKGDITEIEAEAIVNAANNELWMGAGVAGAIKRRGGQNIETEAIRKGPIAHGAAVETTAGKLKAKYVIHAAAMRSDGYITADSLRKSVENSLKLADRLGLSSIAFPAIGTGVAGFPVKDCAEIMLSTIAKFQGKYLQKAFLVLFTEQIYSIFEQEFRSKEKIGKKEEK